MTLRAVALVLAVGQAAYGAFELQPRGSRSVAMGNALVAFPGNEWAALSNPGILPTVPERTVSLFYSPQMFGLKELSHGSFSYVEPAGFGTLAFSGSRFGFELYKEVTVTVSYARQIADRFEAGISINYYSLSIRNYGTAGAVGVDLGMHVGVSSSIGLAFTAFNLNAPKIGEAQERLPQVFSAGVCYQPVSDVVIAAAIEKDIRFAAEFRVGVQYTLLEILDLRVGSTTEPSTLNAGVGLRYSFVQIDYALASHPELGMTHNFSVTLSLGGL